MRYVFGLLAIALIVKDTAPLGDSYILRGMSEGIALMVGFGWLLTRHRPGLFRKYILIFAYLVVLLLTITVAERPVYVAFQVISLIAVVLFFVAYVESHRDNIEKHAAALRMVVLILILICVGSLALFYYRPQLAYDSTVVGNRFKGLFGKPAMMGAISGLLLGLVVFLKQGATLRSLGGFAALFCLYLTGSRTFWAAAVLGIFFTAALYFKHKWAWVAITVAFVVLSPVVMMAVDVEISQKDRSRVLRSDSLEHLSGRTVIWKAAFKKFWDSPSLGYGFTSGSDALKGRNSSGRIEGTPRYAGLMSNTSFTLHNGYLQALLDSGLLGGFFYMAIIGSALWNLFIYDVEKKHGAEMYSLVFLAVSNFGETVIFSAAVFHAVFYWYLVIFALHLRKENGCKRPAYAPSERPIPVIAENRFISSF